MKCLHSINQFFRLFQIEVTISGVDTVGDVCCSRNVVIKAEKSIEDCKDKEYDAVVLPGGLAGSKAMASSEIVGDLIRKQFESGRIVAAICAAPTALLKHKIGLGKSITSYPNFQGVLAEDYKYVTGQKVVQDGNLITSQGPGTSFDFALTIVKAVVGEEKAKEVAQACLWSL